MSPAPAPNSTRISNSAIARLFAAVFRDRRGTSAVEYGLIAALIVIAMFAGLREVANVTISMWNYVAREVVANA